MSRIDEDYNKLSPFRTSVEMDSNNSKPIFSKGSSESVTPSPKKPFAGASSLRVRKSAPPKAIPESVASPTTPSPFPVFETPEFDDDNISAPPAERKLSLDARNSIKRALHQESSSNERLRDATRKKRKTQEDGKFSIGHHCKEPRLRIFAREGLTGKLRVYATRKDLADPDIQRKWDNLVPRNNQVSIDNVILDKILFSAFGEGKGLDKERKSQLVRDYLASENDRTPMVDLEDLDSSSENPAQRFSCDPPYLHVGEFKNDNEHIDQVSPVRVHARIFYSGKVGKVGALRFRVLDDDADRGGIDFSRKRTLRYEQVRILPKYLKETPEETKTYIKTHFTKKVTVTIPVDAKSSRGTASSIILGPEEREINRPIDDAFVAFENATKTLRTTVAEYEAELVSRKAKVTLDEMSMKDGLEQHQKSVEEHNRRVKEHGKDVVKLRKQVKELQKSVEIHDQSVEAHKKAVKELEKQIQRENASGEIKERLAKRESRIEELEQLCLEQKKQITELQAQVNSNPHTQSTQTITAEPTAFAPEISLNASQTFEDTFDLIPDGEINAGMFMEKRHQRVMIGGKRFQKFRILQHPSLSVKGTPESEPDMSYGGFGATKYTTPDGPSKLVEIFSPRSLVQYNGRFMIQWVVLKELDYTI